MSRATAEVADGVDATVVEELPSVVDRLRAVGVLAAADDGLSVLVVGWKRHRSRFEGARIRMLCLTDAKDPLHNVK